MTTKTKLPQKMPPPHFCNPVALVGALLCAKQQLAKMRNDIAQIAAAALLFVAAAFVEHCLDLPMWGLLLVYLAPYLVAGFGVLREAVEKIAEGDVFSEDLLMSVATLGALSIGFMPGGESEMAEAVFVMLFFRVGELFEDVAEGRSRRAIAHLVETRADVAHVLRGGVVADISPDDLRVGDRVVVRPGEKIPADGVVVDGASSLNTVALTGESLPRDVGVGDKALSGCVNLQGALTVEVEKVPSESTAAKVVQLVEEADRRKSRSEKFITRFARVYTPIVIGAALVLAFVPPLFAPGAYAVSLTVWLNRALTFLVVSCPCALVISVPLTFFGGIGGASRRGILIKGSSHIDALSRLGVVVFDKTGTLTRGQFAVTAVCPSVVDERELLHLAAHVESFSTHPIAAALAAAGPALPDQCDVRDVEERPGLGICATVGGRRMAVGNAGLMEAVGARVEAHDHAGSMVYVAIDGRYAGHVVVADTVKDDSSLAIAELRRLGVGKAVMLTGDREEVAASVAKKLGIDEWHSGLLPADKLRHVERLLGERPAGRSLCFVGDGVNDAPVLTRADVGMAMGALGSDAAIEAADVVLMDDRPSKVALAVRLSRRVVGIARQNVAFAIGVKVAVLGLASVGLATMWMAAFADVGVTVLAVLNATRAFGGGR